MDDQSKDLAARRLQAVWENVTEAIVELNTEGRIVAMNPAAERLWGCSEASVSGQNLAEHWRFSRDDKSRFVEIDPLAAARENDWLFSPAQSLLLKIDDRPPVSVEMTCKTIRDNSTEAIAGVMLVICDLAERRKSTEGGALTNRRAEQALRESEERLDRIANAVPSFVWSAAPDGTITWCNAHWYEYTGLREVENGNWLESIHPDDRERHQQSWAAALKSGSDYLIEVRYRRHDGVYRWFQTRATPVRDAQNQISSWFGSCADIDDLRNAEEARRDSQQRLRFALSAAALGEWEIDLKTGKARTSLEHDRCFGFSQPVSGWSTEKFFNAVHPEDRDEVRQIVRAAREAGQVCQFECRVIWPDRSTHWIEAHSTIYPGADGRPSHVAGIVRDITTRKESEAALREAYRNRDEFLANVSHEIRNPMASLMGYAELLSARLKDPTDVEFVRIIKNSGEYLLTLINDLLDLAKMEAGKLEIVREPTALLRLLNEVHTLMISRARDKGLQLSLRLEGSLPGIVETDPIRLRQVLINLIGNAINFTEQGEVDLIARYDEERALLELQVVDSGIGMVPDAQRRLFEPFSQFASTTALRQGGSGLGLAITRQLVDLMGGSITCESELGKGSRFRVSLPTAIMNKDNSTQPQPTPQSLNILLIDDNRVTCKSMSMLLEMGGHRVQVAYDGRSALTIARHFRPDVVVSDIKLPDMDGFSLMRALRDLGGMEKTKFIALSGYGESEFPGAEPKFHHFLQKPLKVEDLEMLLWNN